MDQTTKKDKAFSARIPMDLFKGVRHFAAEQDISTNSALCALLERALEWEKNISPLWTKEKAY